MRIRQNGPLDKFIVIFIYAIPSPPAALKQMVLCMIQCMALCMILHLLFSV